MSRNGNPLGHCTWIILTTIRNRSNMSIAKMFASREEQSINRVFHSSMHGSRVIVADMTKGCRGMETRWDLVLELFREPLEIDQICQLQRCSPRWEEQSNYRVFLSSISRSRVIVADTKKMSRNWNPLGVCTWIISRTIRDRSNMSIAKMFALLRGTIY